MLGAGRFSNDSSTDADKRPNVCTRAHEHTVSRPNVDPHAGTYKYSDEFAYCHVNTDFGAIGNGYTNPDGHANSHKYTVSDTGSNRRECPNSHINTRDIGDIVSYTHPHRYTPTHKLAHPDADSTTHGCPDRHAHTDAHSN